MAITIEMVEPVHPSSRVKKLGFHKESNTIVVEFPGPTVYHYKGPEETFELVRTSESPGASVKILLDKLTYHKVSAVPGATCDCFGPDAYRQAVGRMYRHQWVNIDGACAFEWTCKCGTKNRDDFGTILPDVTQGLYTLPCTECSETILLPLIPEEFKNNFPQEIG